ncbi:MAG: GntR family transcriptional regulator [Thermodesulfobacteriota bacterium]
MLNKNSPIPLYHQLAELIAADIRAGVYGEGDRIPSEHQLVARYGIGRPTVRQALETLVRRGVLARRRGSGTYVAPQPEAVDLFSLAGTVASFTGAGLSPVVEILEGPARRAVPADPANPFAGGQAIALSRLSRVEDSPVLVEDIFLHPALFAGLEDMDLAGQSLSRLAAERFHLVLSGGEQQFRIDFPDDRLSRLLALPRTAPILVVNRTLHFPDAPRAVFSVLSCRTDRFVFTQQLGALTHG